MLDSVCRGVNILKFDRGRLEQIVKKKYLKKIKKEEKKHVALWESRLTIVRLTVKKEDC